MDLPPMSRVRRARTTATATALCAVVAFTVTGCSTGGNAGKASQQGPGAQSTQGGLTLKALWPLTGLPVKGKPPTHPPLVVKIDNTYSSQPQLGLARADLVTEELVEGGLTRLAVFFDTQVPALVGPVRSMRASDVGLVKPVDGLVVTSGVAAPTYGRLKAAGVRYAANGGPAQGFYRDSGRRAPYNLLMKLGVFARALKQPTKVIQPYLPWGTQRDFTGTAPARSITARFGGGHTTLWSYQAGKYVNTNSNAVAGSSFKPDTVIVVRVGVRDAGYLDPAGHFVPESITTGSGNALVFHKGKVERGSWSKSGPSHTWAFKTKAGALKIPAGHTWIEVLPVDSKGGSLSFHG
ncbi:MAG: DUF3048 domain-containing protein [Marmoricola sp.]